jgi:hypothetical protein
MKNLYLFNTYWAAKKYFIQYLQLPYLHITLAFPSNPKNQQSQLIFKKFVYSYTLYHIFL